MCGIAGFAGRSRGASEALLETMTETLRHRGPDDSGFYCRAGVGLGSRRLAVIDLESGKQPISGERGHVVVFNGEIYNFKPLRSELERRGHRFKTHADTEVIVHLYEEKGVECFKDLSGMFAIALWDPEKEQLVLARDPLGVKPLYYAVAAGGLYFGSELKALRKVPEVSLDIDSAGLDSYLDHLHIPAPRSIYREVFKLCPGQWLIWRDGSLRTGTFWEPRVRPVRMDWSEAVAGLDGLLSRILEDQRAADVPIGLFLSGGLDSSALAYYLAGARVPPEAFCVYFSGKSEAFNEVHKARTVARHLGLTLNELRVEPGIEDTLDPLLQALDEPLADSSALPTYWISRAARGSVKVALTGIGGDEVFGGYPRYLGAKILPLYQKLPGIVRRGLSRAAPLIPERVSSRNVGGWARRFLASGAQTGLEAYGRWMGHLSIEDKAALYSDRLLAAYRDFPARIGPRDAGAAAADLVAQAFQADLSRYLPEDLLTLADRASMSVGLELRVPLCDIRLAEFMLNLPSSFRVRGVTLKPLLKDLLKNRLPPEILSQKKQGFMVPLGHWFRDEMRSLTEKSLEDFGRRGIVRAGPMRAFWKEHLSGRRNRTDTVWAVFLLEQWFRRYHPDWRMEGAPGSSS